MTYSPRAGELVLVDVSEHQGPLDWHAIAAAGVAGAYVRVAEGITPDKMYQRHRMGAESAGLLVGGYQYCRARHNAMDMLEVWHRVTSSGAGLTLPPVLDVEETDGYPEDLASCVRVWASALPSPMVYTGAPFADAHLRRFEPGDIPLWLAAYVDHEPVLPSVWKAWTLWQFTDRFAVAGMHLDASVFRGTRGELAALALDPSLGAFDVGPSETP